MMKFLRSLTLWMLLSATIMADEEEVFPPVYHSNFQTGEVLDYKVYYSFINVGRARAKLHPHLYRVNGRKSYKMDIWGKTYGAIDWLAQVDDNWGGYVDSVSLLPHMSYRYLSEGNYSKKEIVRFDHYSDMIEAKVINNKTGKFQEPDYFKKSKHEIRDIISGYMFLRSVDFSAYQPGDTLVLDAFFEDDFYEFPILYEGKDKVKTSVGKLKAHKLKPVMPDNKLFDGENAITIWLSDDENKVLLKASANLLIGKAGIELMHFEGLKHPLNFIRKKSVNPSVKEKMDDAFSDSVDY